MNETYQAMLAVGAVSAVVLGLAYLLLMRDLRRGKGGGKC